jgi:hypothetical protein
LNVSCGGGATAVKGLIKGTAGPLGAIYEGLQRRLTKNAKQLLQQKFFIFWKNILDSQVDCPPSAQLGRPETFVLSNIQILKKVHIRRQSEKLQM